MRVTIMGNAGSGKSTLARSLAGSQIPLLDLDTIFWQRDMVAVPRPHDEVLAELAQYCAANPQWVIEGCYGNLVEALLPQRPKLIYLNPGTAVCLSNCRARPWEPHKYKSKAEQDAYLATLLEWVAAYETRTGHMSHAGHRAIFDAYDGPKEMITQMPPLQGID